MNPQQTQHIADQAIRRAAHERAEQFTEYVLDAAGATIAVRAVDPSAVADSLHKLHQAGYPVDEEDDPNPVGFVSLPDYHRLLDAQEYSFREPQTERQGVQYVPVEGARFYAAAAMPEGTLLVLHPDATAPTYPASDNRPWIVTDPEGVVRVEVE